MQYAMLTDFVDPEEYDDALYGVMVKDTEGSVGPESIFQFSAGDVFAIRNGAPDGADAIALKDDWVYWNSESDTYFGNVFGEVDST